MNITTIKTEKITAGCTSLTDFLDQYIPPLEEKSILLITSKVVSLLEKSVVEKKSIDKDVLIKRESEYYLSKKFSKLGFILTIKNSTLIPSAGIDESNATNQYVLWPRHPFKSAREIWKYLKRKYHLKHLGVIITDSKTTPLRWGTTGISISFCGLDPLKNYIGRPDIFGRLLKVTKANIVDGLAAAAVVQMGEGNEQTPMAIIKNLTFVHFKTIPPTISQIKTFYISMTNDLYSPLLSSVRWRRGGSI